mmetsp:Transcript_64466/g.153881  ORF Transcript_64466/g.153881 Transcript_64466/m.153881 type:complete len:586 (+) Transcript_64466:135-1892(+)
MEAPSDKPVRIGVMGGSFNPIHLGHALLAITVKESKPIDTVVLVPTFKHPVKTNLLAFEDRVEMCRLAVASTGVEVSTIEEETGESNAVMLLALKAKYPPGSTLFWVCGDDVFDWIDNAKGQAMMGVLDGLIVQRRLQKSHNESGKEHFFKAPVNDQKVAALCLHHNVGVDFIYGELPHFSSTLVRSSPASWRAFLPQKVALYLDARPELLQQLIEDGIEAARAAKAKEVTAAVDRSPSASRPIARDFGRTRSMSFQEDPLREAAVICVMRCLKTVHALQRERGLSARCLALGGTEESMALLQAARQGVDECLPSDETSQLLQSQAVDSNMLWLEEVRSMADELNRTVHWLEQDRKLLDARIQSFEPVASAQCWLRRALHIDKYNSRVAVLLDSCTCCLAAMLDVSPGLGLSDENEAELLLARFIRWADCKESLGRERAFVCCGGENAPELVKGSLRLRQQLSSIIAQKDACLSAVQDTFSLQQGSQQPMTSSMEALNHMLRKATQLELQLMGCLAPSTPLLYMHYAVADGGETFTVETWWEALTLIHELMLGQAQALAANVCALAAKRVDRLGSKTPSPNGSFA